MKIVINSIGLQQLYGSVLPSDGIVDEIVYQKESLENITKMDIKPLVESNAIELDKIDLDLSKESIPLDNMAIDKIDLDLSKESIPLDNMAIDKIDIDKEKPGYVSTELVFKNFNW